ncbi:MAG: hypothetical protein ABUL62_23815 [Myxococcales bacterium]
MRGGRGLCAWIWVGCAVGLVIGCGGKYRESSGTIAEAGTAGAAAEVRGGAAGVLIAGGAGVSTGGAGDVAGAVGVGGEPEDDAPGCLGLVGLGVAVEVAQETYSFCRGQSGEITIAHASGLSDMRFSCCAVSDTSPKYSLVIHGSLGADLQGSFGLTPPLSAPLGHQNLNVTCPAGGRLERPIAIQLFGVPEVTSVSSEIHPTDIVRLEGKYLTGASIRAQSSTGAAPTNDCFPVSADDGAIACKFSHITPGQYDLVLQNAGCPGGVWPLTVLGAN